MVLGELEVGQDNFPHLVFIYFLFETEDSDMTFLYPVFLRTRSGS